ncbi:ATP-binding protein, partial [Geitlerinema sp. P-1104]|nr:ATP-binding protein [Geitlerinema sp. P-1104]
MADIITLLKQNYNPFDLTTARSGNFWLEQQSANLTVESIHQEQLREIIQVIEEVQLNQITRTILLKGDLASGKSYFLGRLKKQVNQKALFAYIGSWSDNDYIWRHILRQTVDSLMQTPENESQSQFLLWLNSLSAFQDKSLIKKILGEKTIFVQNFKSSYPTGIYQAKNFFSALYHATQPDDYIIACDWLRGEDLDTSDLNRLGVRKSLSSEEDAKNILMNLGRVSAQAQYPIVLCFDQVDQACFKEDGLPALLGVNTTIHNEKLKNFVIILSLIQSTWENKISQQLQADQDRIDRTVQLDKITIDQAEEIWQKRLRPLHEQAKPQPESSIAPLTRDELKKRAPGGKIVPRTVIQLGHKLIQQLKGHGEIKTDDSFALVWDKEFKKTQ